MGKPHDRLLRIYKQPENLEPIIHEEIKEIIVERKMKDVFTKCYSELTPDLYVFTKNDFLWIGEIKGNHNQHCLEKAHRQINRYLHEAERYDIYANGFIIVGDYIELIK